MTVTLSVPAAGPAPALLLRPWRAGDLPALVAAHRDPVLRRRVSVPLTGEAEARRWLDEQAAGWAAATRFSFAVVAEDGPPLGHVVVKTAPAEVGYWTAAHARGRGIAARALEAVSRWALDEAGLVRLELLHAVDNHPSCRVAEKCGYVLHGLLPAAPPEFPGEGHRHVRVRR
ncbi:GNAT family N-acetyltransferase [Lentzea sp. NPDC059081]|uniref:GNAT family N-acetyltransferase n=1 Tax=Lentzea sp. NPDC059081 TaxID=3346719 RepID=UPI0036B76DC0